MEKDDLYRMIDQAEGRHIAVPALIRKVYTWMAMALAITGITAYGVAISPNLFNLIFSSKAIFFGLIIAELAMVIILSARLHKLSLTTATMMFIGFSVLNGVTLSSIFLAFTTASIAKTFFICAGTFAAMSIYGAFTKTDLSSMGKLMFMALIGLIIASVVSLFVRSTGLDLIISYAGVLIFVGLTAWDTQKIKMMLANADYMDESAQKIALIGALSLYLDFINLFLYLLRIFGARRD
jgi:FtsH-binding integral membrane protein